MTTHGLPSFEEVEASLGSDAPRRWGLKSRRGLTLAAEPASGAVWLLCPMSEIEAKSVKAGGAIKAELTRVENQTHLRIGSDLQPLLREVFYFLSSIVDRAEQTTDSLVEVIEAQIAAWKLLLRTSVPMDKATQLGLLGELWVLWRLIGNLGSPAIKSWLGSQKEQHDFRLAMDDLEVKTTLAHARDHTISGLNQLLTPPGRRLSVVSVQLKPSGAGPGFNLNQAIERISNAVSQDVAALDAFNQGLAKIGYRAADAEHYVEQFSLRTTPSVIEVDGRFPILTTEMVANCMPSENFQRFRKVLYTVNLDGLGTDIDDSTITSLLITKQGDIDA